MSRDKSKINYLTCRFEDQEIENEFQIYRTEKSWKFILFLFYAAFFIGWLIKLDDIKVLGLNSFYISYHFLEQILFFILLFSSTKIKKKYYENYFFISWIGLMNTGAWVYYHSTASFPAGAGAITIAVLFSFIMYPFSFIKSVIAGLLTSIPMAIMIFHKLDVEFGHLIYGLFMPFVFLAYYKHTMGKSNRLEFYNEKMMKTKQKEIEDSISYAKKIQDAMLVSENYLKETLPKSFVLHIPKDIVSGDFYWVYRDENDIYFTVSDCTGHGIPGSLMSMIGTTLLNEIVIEMKIKETDKILNEIRNQIIKTLHQDEDNSQKDGMDMTLVRLNKKKNEIEFSSANNMLVHVSDGNLYFYKGDHQPVGFYSGKQISFTKQKIKVNKNDMIYLFSDGYQDQFGGERNKKFMISKLKKLLLKISNENVDTQLQKLKTEFELWKGNEEQIDDVCLMGVRII